MSRFSRFEKTNLYLNFGSIITANLDILDETELEFYTNTTNYLLETFGCSCNPTQEQISRYMDNDEYIEEDEADQFISFIHYIFEKYHLALTNCKNIHNKSVIKDKKQKVKDKVNTDKQKEKEEKKRKQDEYNNQILICRCGLEYQRSKRNNHITSNKHVIRMECIDWILQPNVLENYISNIHKKPIIQDYITDTDISSVSDTESINSTYTNDNSTLYS